MIGHGRVRRAMAELLDANVVESAVAVVDRFRDELDGYAEIIVGADRRVAGFMTRGEDPSFTERAQATLEQLGMPAEARAHHRMLSEWFEHARAFLKVEWDSTTGAPLVATYFRRRPAVEEVIARAADWNVTPMARDLVASVAAILEQQSIHFVAAAFRPGQPIRHKLYFSQWVTSETRAQVAARIARVIDLFAIAPTLEERWRWQHEQTATSDDATMFVSIAFTNEAVVPSLKIDYPDIAPKAAARWLADAGQDRVILDGQTACTLAGTSALTFLGVRLDQGQEQPMLKYYCDVPTNA